MADKFVNMMIYTDRMEGNFPKSKGTVLGYPSIVGDGRRHALDVCSKCPLRKPISSVKRGKRFNSKGNVSLVECDGTGWWKGLGPSLVKVVDSTDLVSAKRFPVLNEENLRKAMKCQK